MNRDERLYRFLLRAYPARFRESYEHEMLLVFRDQRRDGAAHDLSYWTAQLADVVRSAPREWHDDLASFLQPGALLMKGMAVVAVLVAVFELVNAAMEIAVGGVAGRETGELFAISLAMLAPALLLVSGISLFRRGRAAATLGIVAAVSSIVAFGFLGATHPILSVMAMLLGIGFPVALLAFLLVGRGTGTPRTA